MKTTYKGFKYTPIKLPPTSIKSASKPPPSPPPERSLPASSHPLTPSVRLKFKQTLEEFDRLRFQSKRYTRKPFDSDLRGATRVESSLHSNNNDMNICSLRKEGDSEGVIKRKKQRIEEKLLEVSSVLRDRTTHSVSMTGTHETSSQMSTVDKYYVLRKLDIKKQGCQGVLSRMGASLSTENNSSHYEKNHKGNPNKILSTVKAITVWGLNGKWRKLMKKKLELKKKIGLKDIGKMLTEFLHRLKKLKLTPKEVLRNPKIFTKKPFEREGAFMFFRAVKENDLRMCLSFLTKKKYYIYDFNQNKETPLHLAIRLGYTDLALCFIDLGADVDAQDLENRTPLFLAVKDNNETIVKALLYNRANPWNLSRFEYQKLCRNEDIILLLRQARRLDLFLKMTPAKYREGLWLDSRKAFE